ncbi:unnamed protein product [Prorocentrum cordatum]|uniref:Helicase superfamily 3 single-stranded DNA/RNA virus domain-containing protein n=1 Tax=Prorocentrum cordatum TaxID=2364126 RepID=A0ABN9Y401_9DINO|nr:unnamed protein product [Polarella glacialis]
MPRQGEPSKSWGPCTLFEFTDDDVKWLDSLEVNQLLCTEEICPTTERKHLQFHITFKRAYRLPALKKMLPRVHWEAQYCTQDDNYSRKRDSKVLIGKDNRKRPGERTDLQAIKRVLTETNSVRSLMPMASSSQQIQFAKQWLEHMEQPRPVGDIEVHWRWGKTGVGKTRYVWDMHGVDEIYQPTSYKWWQGYDGHKIVLIDELRANWCTFGQLLRLLDRYPFTVETKGGSRQIQATVWYITSSKHPAELFDPRHFDAAERVDQLLRRLTTITEVLEPETAEQADAMDWQHDEAREYAGGRVSCPEW